MPAMRFAVVISLGLLVSGCFSTEAQGVKTPDEIIAEQEAMGAEQLEDEKTATPVMDDEETDSEKAAKFDKKQAKLELQRAARSAATCPDSLPDEEAAKAARGTAEVQLWFENSGAVQKATLAPPHADTPVGACILRAMEAIIVPAFTGEVVQISWKIELNEKKK
jgi:hypothetical protein